MYVPDTILEMTGDLKKKKKKLTGILTIPAQHTTCMWRDPGFYNLTLKQQQQDENVNP